MTIEAELKLAEYVDAKIEEVKEQLSEEEFEALKQVLYEIGFNRGTIEEMYRQVAIFGYDEALLEQVLELEHKNGNLVKACCKCLRRNGFE